MVSSAVIAAGIIDSEAVRCTFPSSHLIYTASVAELKSS
jgi:hypothetical protein